MAEKFLELEKAEIKKVNNVTGKHWVYVKE
jgi:hypothetical protein